MAGDSRARLHVHELAIPPRCRVAGPPTSPPLPLPPTAHPTPPHPHISLPMHPFAAAGNPFDIAGVTYEMVDQVAFEFFQAGRLLGPVKRSDGGSRRILMDGHFANCVGGSAAHIFHRLQAALQQQISIAMGGEPHLVTNLQIFINGIVVEAREVVLTRDLGGAALLAAAPLAPECALDLTHPALLPPTQTTPGCSAAWRGARRQEGTRGAHHARPSVPPATRCGPWRCGLQEREAGASQLGSL